MQRISHPRDGRTLAQFGSHQDASVMVEVLLGLPIVFLMLAFVLHLASAYYINTQILQASSLAARQLASGRFDNETNGIYSPCSQLLGTSPIGTISVEAMACSSLTQLNADISILAVDDNPMGLPSAGSDVSVSLRIPRNQVTLMLWSLTDTSPELYVAQTSMQAQAALNTEE